MTETIKIAISLANYPALVALAKAKNITPSELIRRMLVFYAMRAVVEWEGAEQ